MAHWFIVLRDLCESYIEFKAEFAASSKNAPPKDYSLESSGTVSAFNAFNSISIIAAIFGNGILPEIQVNYSADLLYSLKFA